MPRKSNIYDLPDELQEAINALINSGVTYTDIATHLKALGVDNVSRSSVGRYGLEQKKIAAKSHRMHLLAEAFVSGAAGKSPSKIVKSAAGMIGGLLLEIMDKADNDEGVALSVADARDMGRAIESVAKAQKLAQNMDIDGAKQEAEQDAAKADDMATGATIQIEFVEPAPQPKAKRVRAKPAPGKAVPGDNAANARPDTQNTQTQKGQKKAAIKPKKATATSKKAKA